ncbi:MAG: 1-deoxy-D-xylulose-5-phosphate synthase [Oscillospiraceae bacterium]|nr:1-deoxy-D-xylulose-5-phosphate synthase [Oscillospiraceae bacterium]
MLETISSPKDIEKMSIPELYTLCDDLRAFLLKNISQTGGHLASNLGVVELTVSIHNVFDTSRDRLIFDVGHQCYVHKILTGRREDFTNLRRLTGVSGFPDPSESGHDAFISGHASTSVSVSLGMARARTLLGEDYSVIALIGDGALTGGLAYEGLSDAGQSGEPLIVILNDNEMSITENVGGLARHLAHLRVRPYYLSLKKVYRKTIAKIPLIGKGVTKFFRKIKSGFKKALLPSSMFENMGFVYLGPVDGHNIKEICRLLKVAREIKKPVLIHMLTIKGKGYQFAEDKPEQYHGVSCFNVKNGEQAGTASKSFSEAFGKALTELAGKDNKICAITAAMKSGTGLDGYAQKYPDRFFDVGIAEGHAVTMAGGLAKQGMIPVCAIYSTFLQRAYDMLFHDVCLAGQKVIFAVDRAGLVADDGKTHQGTLDVGMLLQMPNMKILCPSDISEVYDMLRFAIYETDGPVAIRYPRSDPEHFAKSGIAENSAKNAATSKNSTEAATISRAPYRPMMLKSGRDVAIITYGRLVHNSLRAADLLDNRGVSAAVIKLTRLDDVTVGEITSLLKNVNTLFVVEECAAHGSLASLLALDADSFQKSVRIVSINLGQNTPPVATTGELMKMYGLDADGIAEEILRRCK